MLVAHAGDVDNVVLGGTRKGKFDGLLAVGYFCIKMVFRGEVSVWVNS